MDYKNYLWPLHFDNPVGVAISFQGHRDGPFATEISKERHGWFMAANLVARWRFNVRQGQLQEHWRFRVLQCERAHYG